MKNARMQNEINLCIEYVNDKVKAKGLYGGNAKYDQTVAEIEEALAAKVEQVVTSGRIFFSGFPANMGEAGLKMTLEAFGPLKDLSSESEDGLTFTGKAEFEEVSAAKAAIDKY